MTLLTANDFKPESGARPLDGTIVDICSRLARSCAGSDEDMHVVAVAHIERRLAAILMADVAGYSRLVGADEHGTLVQWRTYWDGLVAPAIASHTGRVVRVTGDGILAEFASIVNAMRCALAIQRGMAERNADIEPERRIEFRMGLNVGDVIVDRGDMWGEGVNVTARLEALAEPGGICVSERVHQDIRGKLDIAFEDLGERSLKNIAHPVRVYRAALPADLRGPSARAIARPVARADRKRAYAALAVGVVSCAAMTTAWLAQPSAPVVAVQSRAAAVSAPLLSIAVLPFKNVSSDAAQHYIADGITDSLTSDLSRTLPGSFVLSRETAAAYKGRAGDAQQIGRELDVHYVLAGSIHADRGRVRVNTQLIDTRSGNQAWSERFDAERISALQVEEEIVTRLSRAIGLKVVELEAEQRRQENSGGANPADLVLRGEAALNRPSSQASMIEARTLFDEALQIEPKNADALAGLATTLVFEFVNGYYDTGGEERLARAEALLDRALALAPRHVIALKAKAALSRAEGRFEDAIALANGVIAENPGEPWAYKELGLSSMYLGRLDEALAWFAKAERIAPRDPARWTWLDGRGQALILLGRDEEAVRSLIAAAEANPRSPGTQALLAAAYALVGRANEAQSALATYVVRHPDARVSTFRQFAPVPLARTGREYQARRERLLDGLRKAGMPE